jgi:hypothetical protein
MSKLQVQGNASGTGIVTLAAPNTNSDYTVTLPAATGSINTSGAANEVPAGSAAAPAITTTGDANTGIFFPAADTIAFSEGGVEAARFDSSGNLLVGTTSTNGVGGLSILPNASLGAAQINFNRNNTISGSTVVVFRNAGTLIGSITHSNTSTSYNTTSDYRLKENVAPMTGALEKVAALKPCTYTWKADGSAGQGFIAHELQAVVPDCVSGEKDAVEIVDDLDAEGRKIGTKEVPRYQGVDTSFLVATLVAAIQEQQTLIADLTTRLEALENK